MLLVREPAQNSTYLVDQTNKHLYKKSELLSEIAFPKKSWNIPQKMFMMESRYNKVTSFPTFSLNILNFFRAAIL